MRGQVCDRVLRFLEVARRDDDRGSGLCQPLSHAEPDAAIAAGHHGDLSAQIDERRVVARIEASASHADDMLRRGIDIRYVVTSLPGSDAEHIYETIYCARGQAENLIKQHKAQLASDRTSCRSPLANQMRLILHTGAYWLLLDLRAAIPSWNPLRHTEFATIRLRLLKIAGRFIEHASRIRIALASCCPEAETFSLVALKLQPSGP